MSPESLRVSHDLDLFHDTEKAVADAYAGDIRILKDNNFAVETLISQPGFIRARIQDASDSLLIDWAQDSIWRFLEPVPLETLVGKPISSFTFCHVQIAAAPRRRVHPWARRPLVVARTPVNPDMDIALRAKRKRSVAGVRSGHTGRQAREAQSRLAHDPLRSRKR